jgi:hypothetical protein
MLDNIFGIHDECGTQSRTCWCKEHTQLLNQAQLTTLCISELDMPDFLEIFVRGLPCQFAELIVCATC